MCLSCKWSDPATFVLGTFGSNPPEPELADVMAVRVPHTCVRHASASLHNAIPLARPLPNSRAQMAIRTRQARQPEATSDVSEEDDALLEQLATDELGRRKLNPRRPNSGMMRGF